MHLKFARHGVAVYGGRAGAEDPLRGGVNVGPEITPGGREARLREALQLSLRDAARFSVWQFSDGRIAIAGGGCYAPRVAVEVTPPQPPAPRTPFGYTAAMKERALAHIRSRRATEDVEALRAQYMLTMFKAFVRRLEREGIESRSTVS
jgi:hypothetical protein